MSKKKSILLIIKNKILDYFKVREDYIQMRLPVEKITKDFEDLLKNKIDHNILHAEIREATKNDAESIIHLHDRAWHSTPMSHHPISKKKMLELMIDSDFVFLIAKVDSIDSAFAIIYLTGDDKKIGVIGALGVLPELQHKGIGTIIGMASWDYFKGKEVKELRCKVHKDNKDSYSFIDTLGFEEFYPEEGSKYLYKF